MARGLGGRWGAGVVGQPTHALRPDVLQPGELAPGVHLEEYSQRRRSVAALMGKGEVALLASAPEVFVAGIIPYNYRQDADMLYATGISQKGFLAMIESMSDRGESEHRFTVVVPDHSPSEEAWDGPTMPAHVAEDLFGADVAMSMSQGLPHVARTAASASLLFWEPSVVLASAAVQRTLEAAFSERGTQHRRRPVSLRRLTHRVRWRKSPAEQALMRESAQIASSAIRECIQASHPGIPEAHLAARFEYATKLRGAQRVSFPPVVGAGVDGTIVHYIKNHKRVQGGQLVLMDAGCELHGYCSDVSRTWPASGRFSAAQRDLYDVVLETYKSCRDMCIPGVTRLDIEQRSKEMLCRGLSELGVVPGKPSPESLLHSQAFRDYYPHGVGHLLGLDVHECDHVSAHAPLEPGVILTVEPGLYIPDDPSYGAFRGTGIRIEDDVLVRGGGEAPEVLSQGCPIEAEEIEQLASEATDLGHDWSRLRN
ncbi:unnamed protein product [Pedinophyceae sp. YPF-701]|nr:unnamed protein product [Pedinophyceae sp. YPF-701]